jgi:hypothetical protein
MTTPNGSGITNRGTDYADGSQVTSTNLNDIVDDAVFNTNAVDDTTIGLNSSTPKALFVKNQGIDTAQIADDAITSDKLADATLTFIKSALYPVGYILTTVTDYADSAAVVAAFGGTTWVRFGAGQVMVGYDSTDTDFDTVEETGGDKTKSKTIAVNELPKHKHRTPLRNSGMDNNFGFASSPTITSFIESQETSTSSPLTDDEIYNSSNSQQTQQAMSLDVVQPYITVYMWKRTV